MKTGSRRSGPRQDGAAAARTEAPPGSSSRFRRALWVAAAVVLLGALALAFTLRPATGPAGESGQSSASLADAVGGPFHLVDQTGRAVDQHLLDGKWSAVFFGYTSCPDVCPATLNTLGAVQDKLGAADAAKFQVVLVTVDPDRDRPAEMKVYVSQPGFPKGTVGLTGTPQQVADAARAYHAFYRKRALPGGSYEMDHSAFIYLMDPHGRFVRTLAEQEGPDAIAQAIKSAMASKA